MFGLFGGDLGEADGVFLQVEETDIMAELMGDTRAEDRAEFSRCASFNKGFYFVLRIGYFKITLIYRMSRK